MAAELDIAAYRRSLWVLRYARPILGASTLLFLAVLILGFLEHRYPWWVAVLRLALQVAALVGWVVAWRLLRNARKSVYKSARFVLLRPFTPDLSEDARTVLGPILAHFGRVFTVSSEGFPTSPVDVGGSGALAGETLADLFAVEGAEYYDEPDSDDEGPLHIDWRSGVFSEVRRADFAVVDVNRLAPGIRWEINLATSLLTLSRTILVAHRDVDAAAVGSALSTLGVSDSDVQSLMTNIVRYERHAWARWRLYVAVRRRVLASLGESRLRDCREHQALVQDRTNASEATMKTLASQLSRMQQWWPEKEALVWWYVSQAIVEGNDSAPYWLNLWLGEETEEAWATKTPAQRLQELLARMEAAYSEEGAFDDGPLRLHMAWDR